MLATVGVTVGLGEEALEVWCEEECWKARGPLLLRAIVGGVVVNLGGLRFMGSRRIGAFCDC